jgi:hypothetical protein
VRVEGSVQPKNGRLSLDFDRKADESRLLLLCYEEIEVQKAVEEASNSSCPSVL